jgi:hypothetical protein
MHPPTYSILTFGGKIQERNRLKWAMGAASVLLKIELINAMSIALKE